jgi:Protein of unknown function (DUF3102)
MKKAKKPKPRQRQTALDRLAAKLRTALRRETTNIIEIGNLLIESRKHLEHGDWLPWLSRNFDLSFRTAQNYCAAAEYVARKSKSETVAHFANLSASLLHRLAAGQFHADEEAAILDASRKGRVDEDAAWAIRDAFEAAELAAADADDADDQDDDDADAGDDAAKEDAESAAYLDGPPPVLPEPAENLAPTNVALRQFDQAISALKQVMTKPSKQFAKTIHSAEVLAHVEDFIRAVREDLLIARVTGTEKELQE